MAAIKQDAEFIAAKHSRFGSRDSGPRPGRMTAPLIAVRHRSARQSPPPGRLQLSEAFFKPENAK
jgi:hypothetical protein